eukprot:6150606-Pleurochrysis_carterae.AAC.2
MWRASAQTTAQCGAVRVHARIHAHGSVSQHNKATRVRESDGMQCARAAVRACVRVRACAFVRVRARARACACARVRARLQKHAHLTHALEVLLANLDVLVKRLLCQRSNGRGGKGASRA